jgi:hypothetical protein
MPVMRAYTYYFTRDFFCVLNSELSYYKRYYRANRQCELAPPNAEIE